MNAMLVDGSNTGSGGKMLYVEDCGWSRKGKGLRRCVGGKSSHVNGEVFVMEEE